MTIRRAKCMQCGNLHKYYIFEPGQNMFLLWCENCGTAMHEPVETDEPIEWCECGDDCVPMLDEDICILCDLPIEIDRDSDSTSSFDETKLPDEKDIAAMWQALKTDEPSFNQFWSGGDAWKRIKLVTDEIPLMSVDKEKILGFPLTARKSLAGIPIYVYDMMPEDEIWAVKVTRARPPELPEIQVVKIFKVKPE